MKNILLIIIALAAMLLSCISAGCVSVNEHTSLNVFGSHSIKGSGKIVTRTCETPTFCGISASRAVQVIVCDTTDRIVIAADDNLIDYVETIVSKEVLYVSIADSVKSLSNIHVVVAVPISDKLMMLDASSAAQIATAKALQADKFKISASSAAKIDAAVRAVICEIDASSAAKIRVAVSADKCSAEATSASRIALTGAADKFEADLSSSARIDAESLKSRLCDVDASSAAKATVNCSEYLEAEASSGAFVGYMGNCRTNISSSSGGRVRQQ